MKHYGFNVFFKRITVIFLSVLLIFFSFAACEKGSEDPSLSLTCYDEGKGDAFLLQYDGFNMMIDCGYKDNADTILNDLYDKNVKKLDLLIISHFDKDHVGGASKIVKNFKVNRIITSPVTNDDKRTVKFLEAMTEKGLKNEVPSADILIEEKGLAVKVCPPLNFPYEDDNDNNSSLLVTVNCGCGDLTFTGDAEDMRIDEILERDDLKCDVLKIPHHGTEDHRLKELIDKAAPKTAIITSSIDEPSDDEVLKILEDKGVTVYDTKDTGSFTLKFEKDGIKAVPF